MHHAAYLRNIRNLLHDILTSVGHIDKLSLLYSLLFHYCSGDSQPYSHHVYFKLYKLKLQPNTYTPINTCILLAESPTRPGSAPLATQS